MEAFGIAFFKKKSSNIQLENVIRIKMNMQYDNMYVDEQAQRLKLKTANKKMLVIAIILLLLVFVSIFFVSNIAVNWYSFAWMLDLVKFRGRDLLAWVRGETYVNGIDNLVIRILLIMLTGASLSVCGAVYQGSFKNAMASPTTLGVQSGGSLGLVIYVLFFYESAVETGKITSMSELIEVYTAENIFEHNQQQLLILLGCTIGVFFTVSLAKFAGRGKIDTVALIIAGSVFSSLIGSFTGLVQYYYLMTKSGSEETEILRYAMIGSFDKVGNFEHLILMGIPGSICLLVLILLRNRLNVLVFGEDEARAMGIDVNKYRNILVALCTVLTALIISFCGQIGFIGLMVPHITRFIFGPDFKVLVPASAIMGATLLLAIYNIAVLLGYSASIGLIINLVGGLTFAVIMLVNRRKRNADWT